MNFVHKKIIYPQGKIIHPQQKIISGHQQIISGHQQIINPHGFMIVANVLTIFMDIHTVTLRAFKTLAGFIEAWDGILLEETILGTRLHGMSSQRDYYFCIFQLNSDPPIRCQICL